MKIVISKDTFGFCLNDDEMMRYGEIKGIKIIYESVSNQYYIDTINKHNKFYDFQIPRNDPALVQLVEELNVKLPNRKLKVVEIPDDVDWIIKKQDNGKEYITEKQWNGVSKFVADKRGIPNIYWKDKGSDFNKRVKDSQ